MAREYHLQQDNLKYPATPFRLLIQQMISYINEEMPILCHQPNIYQQLKENIFNKSNVAVIKCPNHEIIFKINALCILSKCP